MTTTTMTQKGQITIPRAIRKALNVDRDSKFLIRLDEENGRVILEPLTDLISLAGSLSSKVTLSDIELEKARAATWTKRQNDL